MPSTRILNVDDNPAGQYAKSRILRFAGYDVLEAASGEDALALARREQPDVVLLDVNLPDVSGYEVCRRLKDSSETSSIPVILTSAIFTRSVDRARGIEGGADGYLVEPIEPEVVGATIQSVLRVRKAEDELRDAALQWKTTFRSITDGIALLNERGNVIRCNPACERLLNRTEGHMSGHNFGEILDELLDQQGTDRSRMLDSAHRVSTEVRLRDRTIEITFDPVFEEGRRTGSVCILSDVTADRANQEALREAKRLAEEANRAKDRFLATLSHELRTPLTPVLLLLEDLRSDNALSEELRSIHEMMYRNVTLEARLIDDLLDLSRIIKGKLALSLSEVDVHDLIDLVSDIVRGDLEQKGLRYRVEPHAKLSRVVGDPARLQQVLWNLLKNAIKFTPAGGEIVVRTENPSTSQIVISVSDTGRGIESEAIDKIFNAFEQAEEKIPQQFGGLGLGLAISKNLAHMHRGDLTVESAGKGRGATFRLHLPLVFARSSAPASAAPAA